jgi:hypothetical protein
VPQPEPAPQPDSSEKRTTTRPPTAPTANVRVKPKANVIRWSASDRAATYRVFRATSRSGPYKRIAVVRDGAERRHRDAIAKERTFHYKVSAVNAAGGDRSAAVAATRTSAAAFKVKANKKGTRTIVTWTSHPKAQRYRILRAKPNKGGFVHVSTVKATGAERFVDKGTTKRFRYRVSAVRSTKMVAKTRAVRAS